MNGNVTKSILEMARGGFMERVDYEMPKIVENILDPNTDPTAKRTITIKMVFTPNVDRNGFIADFSTKNGLAPTSPIRTMLYIAGADGTGEMQIIEMVPQIPGQTAFDGEEQQAPPMLRLVK